jgi:hypothetical protein
LFRKSLAALAMLITVAITVVTAFDRMPTDAILDPAFRARLENDSIAFFGPNLTSAAFWITPFDDAAYSSSVGAPLMLRNDFTVHTSFLGELLITGQRLLLGRDTIVWHVEGGAGSTVGDVIYLVSRVGQGRVRVTRTMDQLPTATTAIGQVIRYCDDCVAVAAPQSDSRGGFVIQDAGGREIAIVSGPSTSDVHLSPSEHTIEVRNAVGPGRPDRSSQEIEFVTP